MKSKKRSGTRRKPLEPITFFVDRSGTSLGNLSAMPGPRSSFTTIISLQTRPTWIGFRRWRRAWIVLTKDKRIRYRTLERDAVIAAKARVFVLASSKGLTGQQMGEIFVRNLARMARLVHKHQPPFIAGVYEKRVTLYELP